MSYLIILIVNINTCMIKR